MGMVVNRNQMNARNIELDGSSDPGILRPSIHCFGNIAELKMGETVEAGEFLYYDETAQEFMKSDADAIASMPVVAMALEAGSNGAYSKALVGPGYVRADFLGEQNRATGTISITGTVSNGDYFTIDGLKYEFSTDGAVAEGVVLVDVSDSAAKGAAQSALLAAMALQVTKLKLDWTDFADDVLTVYAAYPYYEGTEGNAVTLVKSGTNLAVSGGTLTGGNDGGILYASCTAGDGTYTAPSGLADVVQKLGVVISADELLFNPELVSASQFANKADDAATVTITIADHGKVYLIDKTDGITVTLPAASTVLGMKVDFILNATMATACNINAPAATDKFIGGAILSNDSDNSIVRWPAVVGTDNQITLIATTGGLQGTKVSLTAITSGIWHADITGDSSGTEATPFAAQA